LHGVDISKIAIQEAKQASTNICYTQLSTEKTTYPDNFFDYIYMCEVLEHVPEPDKTLLEIRRVLKPNGQFLLAVPQEKCLFTLQGILFKLFIFTPSRQTAGHIQFWNQFELEQLLRKHNFAINNTYYSQHYLWQLIGMAYMLLLLHTKNQTQELSKQLAANKSTLASLANISMQFLILLTNLESLILQRFPHGLDIQFVCQKKSGQ
jgi:ubiquinone/menaquinone biosynthesis C-methylase UbiE